MREVATRSGFGSVRRFNAVFAKDYRRTPGSMRRTSTNGDASAQSDRGRLATGLCVPLAYRPPLDAQHLISFLHQRALPGLEVVDLAQMRYSRSLLVGLGTQRYEGWMVARFAPGSATVHLQLSASLSPALLEVRALCRHLLDLDADPLSYEALLASDFPGTEGMCLPGTVDGFELAVRAILGQQITVAAARALRARLVAAFGTAIADKPGMPVQGISHYFPEAALIADLPASALDAIGMVRQRQAAIIGVARAITRDGLQLAPGAPPEPTLEHLQSIEGVGPWTAQYTAMRALRWHDAFPNGNVALHKSLGLAHAPRAKALAQAASQVWRPWRSYATMRAWHSAAAMGRAQA